MIDNGIKPLYVFDGKPPELKTGELAKRHDKREKNKADLEKAREEGNVDEINKFVRRSVKVTQKHNEECQRLLRYMGVPFVIAKSEAEAQCAELAKNGVVWAVGSEDMDTLMFKAPVLLRRLTFSEARKLPILEFNLEKILEQLGLSYTEFVDLGILLGCDYCDTIRNVGPKTGLQLLQKHRSIEKIIPNLKANSQTVPENFPYETARELFINPEVYSSSELTIDWHMKPNRDEIVKFLCDENGFNRERIIKSIEKLEKGSKAGLQGRLDTFFKPVAAKDAKSTTPVNGAKKRQAGQSGGTINQAHVRLISNGMDYQNRAGSKPGAGGVMSSSESNVERRERLRKLALETIDLAKDPYFMKNHLGSYECKLCLTLHTNEGSYLAHTQGKKHQTNLARRAALDERDSGPASALKLHQLKTAGTAESRVKKTVVKIGRPGYKVTKIRDPFTRQIGFVFSIMFPDLNSETLPRHRFMSAFEQQIEPPNKIWQYLLFSAEPYENIAFKVQNREVDMRPGKFFTHWDPDSKVFTLQLLFRNERTSSYVPGNYIGMNKPAANPLNPYGSVNS
ncbi:Flap endonuclease 1 [Zancudomyces culisetae]|uniref:Flap endonuclease 1 n=1 Tax=Zancudomyces culisetae TaxID=1213189 RepID=A0A1R1PHU0_ZANCU|nr:Flap endonuclease 1 [Zancudomyces culisetae]OMH81529.1 Flap endonuclease 1 [Zancudomyces culisetae]|eukprot:OMH80517.1 Flap endonuclease 1 [Zancudomyces culisetae]